MPQSISQEITDQELASNLRQGKPEALSWMYDKYAPVLLGLAARIIGNRERAEAVLQETFIAIWVQKETYDASRWSMLSWLIALTRDIASKSLLSNGYAGTDNTLATVAGSRDASAYNYTDHTNRIVKEHFCSLEADEKVALDLVYLKGYICVDAAAELEIPLETLHSRLKMAGKHLREGKI